MDNTSFFSDESKATLNPNMKVHPNPFPEKMARAIAFFEKNGLPPGVERTKKWEKKHKKPPLSSLQNELLTVYTFEPTEQQMQQIKDFLAQLFADKLDDSKTKQEAEIVA